MAYTNDVLRTAFALFYYTMMIMNEAMPTSTCTIWDFDFEADDITLWKTEL